MRDRLCLIMIVKNEAANIRRTLESVLLHVDTAFIWDTGSTDDTQALISTALRERFGDWQLESAEFTDFGDTRTRCMRAAEKWLKDKVDRYWFLWMDGDSVLHNGELLRNHLFGLVANEDGVNEDGFYLQTHVGDLRYDMLRVLSAGKWDFEGVVHEVPILRARDTLGNVSRIPGPYVEYLPSSKDKVQAWREHVGLLMDKIRIRGSGQGRNVFYLAQTHHCLAEETDQIFHWKLAHDWYLHRLTLGGSIEETYMAMYRAGQTAERAGRSWEDAEALYIRAANFALKRAEPYYRIALHYYELRDWAKCEAFAELACRRSHPIEAMLFVEHEVYEWRARDLLDVAKREKETAV